MLYFLALVCLSTSPNWAKLNQMPAEVLGFWRLAIASFILIIFQIYKKDFKLIKPNKQNQWIFISGFFFFLHLWTYKYAAKHTLVSNTMVLFATNPIWSSVGSCFFFKDHIAPRIYGAYTLAFTGIIYLVYNSLNFSPEQLQGNISALISAVFYAAYMLSGKKARENHSNKIYATYQYLTCALLFFMVTLLNQQPFIENYSAVSWLAVMGLVALPTFLGHFLMTHLVKTMSLAILTCGKLIEPVIASFIAYFLFHETLSNSIYVSFSMTFLSVIILFWPQLKIFFQKFSKTESIHS